MQQTAYLVTFTVEILNEKVIFLVQCNNKQLYDTVIFDVCMNEKSHEKRMPDQVFLPSEIQIKDLGLTSIKNSLDLFKVKNTSTMKRC